MSLPAKKSLGQNFLKSQKAIRTMIATANVSEGDMIVEIGPGKGAITKPLLETGATVIAFELDHRMIEYLKETLAHYIESHKLILIHQDILVSDIKQYTQGNEYKVVANIPYYITNRIIRFFLSGNIQPTTMSLLVQKEVAERIVAKDNKESILSLSVKLYATASSVEKVSRKYFSPQPKVDSAILSLSNISRQHVPTDDFEIAFFEIVKTAFAQKRKQAIKNLQPLASKDFWHSCFEQHALAPTSRAEDIPFEAWIKMTEQYLAQK